MADRGKNGRITIQDVATAAGVSRTAVYAVLNAGKDINTGVSETLRQKIKDTVKRMGYIPNNSARSLVSGKTCNVGIIFPDYWLLGELAEVFDRSGYMIFPLIHKNDPMLERRSIELLISRGVDAIIISRTSPNNNTELLRRVMIHGIPLIIIAEEREGFPESRHVIFDEHRGMALPVEFMAEHGMRHFALVSDDAIHSGQTRLQYAVEAVRQIPDSKIFTCPSINNRTMALEIANEIKRLSPGKRPQAMINIGDQLAWLMIEALQTVGLRVPEDIQVTGIGNDESRYHLMPLTTVELSSREMAQCCYSAFDDTLHHRPQKLYVVKPELVVRKSAPGKII